MSGTQLELHEERLSKIEAKQHAQDISNALLSKEVNNLSVNVKDLSNVISKVSEDISVILPQIKVSKQWEDIYRAGIFLSIGAIATGLIGMVFSHMNKLSGN